MLIKKGQTSIFIILGIVILIAFFLLFYLYSSLQANNLQAGSQSILQFQNEVNNVNLYVTSCLDMTLLNSINIVGLNETRISDYIESNISKCLNFSTFEGHGLNITSADIEVNVGLGADSASAILKYPLTISRGKQSKVLESFHSEISLLSQQDLPVDANGIVTSQVSMSNGESTLVIPKGTRALDKDGNPIHSVSMRIMGATYPLIGFFRYDFEPGGAKFDPPLALTTNYKDSDLPDGFHEQDLEIKSFDKDKNAWISLPSNIDVVNDKIITHIDHFSEFGPGIADRNVGSQNQVFIITDENWKDVFQLVPMVIWSQYNEVKNHPLLILQVEGDKFDSDSIMNFLNSYNTEKVTLVGDTPQGFDNLLVADKGLGAGLSQNQIQRIDPSSIINYWSSHHNIVYCEDNYKLAMLASTYASFINSPLIIKGSSLDRIENLNNSNVILVGNIECPKGISCSRHFSLEELQAQYLGVTNTNKLILVNPNDIDIGYYNIDLKINNDFGESASSGIHTFWKTSIAAPILASAKQELIIFSDSNTEQTEATKKLCPGNDEINIPITTIYNIQKDVRDSIYRLHGHFEYFTILASPLAIIDAIPDSGSQNPDYCMDWMAIDRVYSDMLINIRPNPPITNENAPISHTNYPLNALKTGRIYGITLSDVSSYIARSIFYLDLQKNMYGNKKTASLWSGGEFAAQSESDEYMQLKRDLESSGYDTNCIVTGFKSSFLESEGCGSKPVTSVSEEERHTHVDWKYLTNRQFIFYDGHGNVNGFAYLLEFTYEYDVPNVQNPAIFSYACLVNTFFISPGHGLFSADIIRKGAVGFFGNAGTGITTDAKWHKPAFDYIRMGHTLGDLDKYLSDNYAKVGGGTTGDDDEISYMRINLFGDPTLRVIV